MDPTGVLGPSPVALAAYARVTAILAEVGPFTTRTTRSQVAFRRRRGFAYLWPPPAWARDRAPVVLSVALTREIASPRWKQVVHPSPGIWMHHLEVRDVATLDDEVRGWLREAWDGAT